MAVPSAPVTDADGVVRWVLDLEFEHLPPAAVGRAQDLLLDTLGVAIAAGIAPAARIAADLAVEQFGGGADAMPLPFDGRTVGAAGCAYALATRIDNLDAHDGYQPVKGHAGVVLVATLLALVGRRASMPSGREVLAAVVTGYEIAARAGISLHARTTDYHSSGAWNALGAVALGARLRGFDDPERLAGAFGIAEYHAPRAPMMREIDNPSMLHDSSGWGALAGVTAILLAERGFSSSPAELIVPGTDPDPWHDLGRRWLTLEQYVKPYPVCFWAQPAVRAALALRDRYRVDPAQIRRVRIETFHEATRLAMGMPATTEVAQYALAFPVAAALVRGRLGPDEIAGSALTDPAVEQLVERVEAVESAECNARFPGRRLAEVVLELTGGEILRSDRVQPLGVPDDPLDRAAIRAKFRAYAAPVTGEARANAIEESVYSLAEPDRSAGELTDLLRGIRGD